MLRIPLNSDFNAARSVADLRPGEGGTVRAVTGRDAIAVRLLEMGFLPGVRVDVRKLAPLGDPMELRVRGFHVSVRRDEARRIELSRPGLARADGHGEAST